MYNMLSANRITGASATFYRHFDQGRGLLAKAVELDEKLKTGTLLLYCLFYISFFVTDGSRATIVEAIETYKKVLEFFSQVVCACFSYKDIYLGTKAQQQFGYETVNTRRKDEICR